MMFILQRLFTMFGQRGVGQLAGSTLVGAVFPAFFWLRKGAVLPGGILVWVVGGAIAGFVAGLFLLSPKRFFGSIFVFLGLALAVLPMSHGDGSPATVKEYAVKIGIGLIFLVFGGFFLVRACRRLA